ncbi:unnamed protein product [Aphis gossypii]|uniref:NTF2 domain-containing protein n=1 Tax=Aphis gossypii TaxID=80765 RepID=A0A9P0ILW9_APHGO|nr:unnamed protein product [Aphis gossypii]
MGNSLIRQTVFRGSWWAKKCRRDDREIVDMTVVDGGCDDAVGHQVVGNFYTEWYNAPEKVWRHFSEDAEFTFVDVDGTKYVASGRRQLQELFDNVAAPETGNHDDGDCRTLVVQSVVTVRCPRSGQLLVVATTGMFTQSFVVMYTAPDPFIIVGSVVVMKRAGVNPQQAQQRRCRPATNIVEASNVAEVADAANAGEAANVADASNVAEVGNVADASNAADALNIADALNVAEVANAGDAANVADASANVAEVAKRRGRRKRRGCRKTPRANVGDIK